MDTFRSILGRLNWMQRYLVEEYVEDYQEGALTRREALKYLTAVLGTAAAAATVLTACTPEAAPAGTAEATAAGVGGSGTAPCGSNGAPRHPRTGADARGDPGRSHGRRHCDDGHLGRAYANPRARRSQCSGRRCRPRRPRSDFFRLRPRTRRVPRKAEGRRAIPRDPGLPRESRTDRPHQGCDAAG